MPTFTDFRIEKPPTQVPIIQIVHGKPVMDLAWVKWFNDLSNNLNVADIKIDARPEAGETLVENSLLKVDASGKVVNATVSLSEASQAVHVDDADAVTSWTIKSGGTALDLPDFQSEFNSFVNRINDLQTTVNSLIESLENAGIMSES